MRQALGLMHIAALLFGLSGVFAALIDSSPVTAVFGRAFFALMLLSGLALCQPTRWPKLSWQEITKLLFIGGLLLVHWLAFFLAVHKAGVAVATLGFACFPVAVSLFDVFIFKQRLSTLEIGQIMLVSLGLILITPTFTFGNQATVGLLLGILSGVVYALVAIFNRLGMVKQQASAIQGCCWQFLGVVLLSLPWAQAEIWQVTSKDIFWIACLGLLSTGIAYVLFIKSLSQLKTSIAAMIIALETVYAILIAWIFLQQVPSWRMLIGGAIIITAVVLIPRKS